MDFEEMNQRAYDRKPEPDGLTPAERMIWLALRLLYELHFHAGGRVAACRYGNEAAAAEREPRGEEDRRGS